MPMDLLRPDDIQSPDDEARAQAERAEGRVAEAIRSALRAVRDAVTVEAIRQALSVSFYRAIFLLPDRAALEADLKLAFDDLAELHDQAARAAADDITAALREIGSLETVAYDRLDPGAVAALQGYRDELIADLTGTMQDAIAQVLTSGVTAGVPQEQLAQDIARTVGLTPQQAQAVANYRRAILAGDASALDRTLRDRRYDATLQRAIAGEYVEPERVSAMVRRYAHRMLDFRAQTIARTETLRAVNRGRLEAYRQAITAGKLDPVDVRRRWLTAHDELVCPVCRSIPLLNARGIALDAVYLSADGPIDAPPVHPRCRCTEEFEIRALAQEQEQEQAA